MVDISVKKIVKRIKKAKTPYEVLGLNRNCTQNEIKAAYRNLSKIVHPDKCNLDDATECFQRVSAANILLKNQKKRRRYDEGHLEEWMYNQNQTDDKNDISAAFVDGLIPSVFAYEDDISPEEIICVLFGDIKKVIFTFKNRNFFTGKMKKEYMNENDDDDDDIENDDNKKIYRKNRFYQSLLYLILICFSCYLLFIDLL